MVGWGLPRSQDSGAGDGPSIPAILPDRQAPSPQLLEDGDRFGAVDDAGRHVRIAGGEFGRLHGRQYSAEARAIVQKTPQQLRFGGVVEVAADLSNVLARELAALEFHQDQVVGLGVEEHHIDDVPLLGFRVDVMLSDQTDRTAPQLWETYVQLIWAEAAFRAMKSHLLLRPMWHRLAGRVRAHVFVCVVAYALWKALDHLLKRAGLMTRIRKVDEFYGEDGPQDRRMSAAAALRILRRIRIGDILLDTTEDRKLRLRRVARHDEEQPERLARLKVTLPERVCADCDVTDPDAVKELFA